MRQFAGGTETDGNGERDTGGEFRPGASIRQPNAEDSGAHGDRRRHATCWHRRRRLRRREHYRCGCDATRDHAGTAPEELAAPGATLATVAAAHGKDRDALKQALMASMQQRLNTAVANGTIAQAASEQTLTQFQSRIDALVDSKGGTTMRSFRTPTPGT